MDVWTEEEPERFPSLKHMSELVEMRVGIIVMI
jgi:hypothetical protein